MQAPSYSPSGVTNSFIGREREIKARHVSRNPLKLKVMVQCKESHGFCALHTTLGLIFHVCIFKNVMIKAKLSSNNRGQSPYQLHCPDQEKHSINLNHSWNLECVRKKRRYF